MGEDFWPDLQGWIWILGQVAAAAAVAARIVVWWLRQEINEKVNSSHNQLVKQLNGMGNQRIKPLEIDVPDNRRRIAETELDLRKLREDHESDMRKVISAVSRLEERTKRRSIDDEWGKGI